MNATDKLEEPGKFDFSIEQFGPARVRNPMEGQTWVEEGERTLLNSDLGRNRRLAERGLVMPSLELAGPRRDIFHDPAWTRAAIVTCGGLAPGLNAVIKGIVQVLFWDYGVKHIYGIPYGYRGLNPAYGYAPLILDTDLVDTIHEDGGTILGSSRGLQDVGIMVDTLQRLNINLLFCVGGDGTLRGAHAIAQEVRARKQPISIIGIPKTIDNDLNLVDCTFGFETAVYAAAEVITSAHMEARAAYQGMGVVKLMGRDSGFIAAHATLANTVVNFCLIPEIPLELDGEHGLLKALERRFAKGKTHGVIVVAEGAGQDLFKGLEAQRDASGNILKHDIGTYLCQRMEQHFRSIGDEISIKYFDPSYIIRSVPAKGTDAIFCYQLAENAVHAGMAGKTDMVVGSWGRNFTHVPIALATQNRKQVDIDGSLWHAVLGSTRQEEYFRPRHKK